MSAFFVPENQLPTVMAGLFEGRAGYGARQQDGDWHLCALEPHEVEVPPHRPVEPLKSLFLRPREDLGTYFGGEKEPQAVARAVVGVTACDLAALGILDWVFLEGEGVDPYYEALRRETLLISVDCSEPRDVCFCTLFGRSPFPEAGFDLNLSRVGGGYLLEEGSQRGSSALDAAGLSLQEASQEQLEDRRRGRDAVWARLEDHVARAGLSLPSDLQDRVLDSRDSRLWQELADKCVECAACNFICPTCHCFLLADVQERQGYRRFRNWDACLYRAFALEASGVNPRARRAERLHGRLEKKLAFIVSNTGEWGCVGCGRCVEACAGEIDMRETLKELINA